jgi:hypothetical protein
MLPTLLHHSFPDTCDLQDLQPNNYHSIVELSLGSTRDIRFNNSTSINLVGRYWIIHTNVFFFLKGTRALSRWAGLS